MYMVHRLLGNRHDPLAASATEMMLRETPLYFLAVREYFSNTCLFFLIYEHIHVNTYTYVYISICILDDAMKDPSLHFCRS